ncbi:M20/M25/M40 family metallo-hydrolase [Prosthecomicrobium sp. N25]|uniref:M20/M25/M40 family metallo-hydrolase n=1 Tax=Prosthecomicrobium sp. N25 TaxID=3129254 RepID=UPI0030785B92
MTDRPDPQDALDRILRAAPGRRDAAVALLRALVAAQRDGETAVQARLAEAFAAAGAAVSEHRYDPAAVPLVGEFASGRAATPGHRTCLVGRLPGTGTGRSLILFAHPDSEPVADADRWSRDPFAGVVDGGRLYGWGVADDLAGVAAMASAVDLLRAAGLRPAGDVILASTPSKRDARGVAALLQAGLAADAAVYLHPAESGAGLREVKAFASGQVEFLVTVAGRAPDTTEPHQTGFAHRAVDPVAKAMLVVDALRRLDAERAGRIRHPLLQAAVGRSTNLLVSHLSAGSADALSRCPTSCTVGGAVSFPPPETLDDVRREIEAAIRAAAAGDPWLAAHPPEVQWVAGVTGAETRSGDLLFRAVAAAVSAVTGAEPFVNPMHTASDIRNPIVQKDIPTVGLGPLGGDLTQNGRTDEWVDLEDHCRMVVVAAGIVALWCGVTEAAAP